MSLKDELDAINNLAVECAEKLAEFGDSVQIMVTRVNDDGGTDRVFYGVGNVYARRGMAQEFVEQAKTERLAKKVADMLVVIDDEDDE